MGARQLFGAAALVAASTVAHGSPGGVGPTVDRPTVEYVDMPEAMIDSVEWAIGLLDEAELPLPDVRFEYHGDDRGPCRGYRGVHRDEPDRSVIGICTSEVRPTTDSLILEELAHAWAAHYLTDDRRAAFQELRGWTYWRNHELAEWHENGSEQAAVIVTWALIDRPIGVVVIHDNSCDDLEAGYLALTGDAPLHGFRDHCSHTAPVTFTSNDAAPQHLTTTSTSTKEQS